MTCFFYFGPLNFDFIFHLFYLYSNFDLLRLRYCKSLEEDVFHGRSVDFLCLLVFGMCVILSISPLFHVTFLGAPLSYMLVYVWSQRNSFMLMNLLGIFNFTANYLPWVLLLFPILFSGNLPYGDLIGIFSGYLYEFVSLNQHPILVEFRSLVLRLTRIWQ